MLGIESGSPARAASGLNCQAISATPIFRFLNEEQTPQRMLGVVKQELAPTWSCAVDTEDYPKVITGRGTKAPCTGLGPRGYPNPAGACLPHPAEQKAKAGAAGLAIRSVHRKPSYCRSVLLSANRMLLGCVGAVGEDAALITMSHRTAHLPESSFCE